MESTSSNMEDLIYEKVREAGEAGIKQNEISKMLGIVGADASRAISKLIKKGLIKKESTVVNGKKIVILYAITERDVEIVVNLESIKTIPCFSCKMLNKCENGSYISPQGCNKMNHWLIGQATEELGG